MKKLLIGASVLMMLAACGASNPEDAVTGFFEAMKAGDGQKAVTYLSQSTIDEIGSGLEDIKSDTTGMAAAMLPMMGINVTPEELQEMSAEDFVAALFSSQMMKDMLGTAEIEVVSSTVNGDAATVHVKMTMNGETDEEDLELVREGGAWKLNLPEFGM